MSAQAAPLAPVEITELSRRVAALQWFHTFDLPGGMTTPGLFDHRPIVDRLLLPERLDGLRCLDAASADGFFAFELKRRGAAEVVSLDGESMDARDWQGPPGPRAHSYDMSEVRSRFNLVREATGLEVQRVKLNLYDISPQKLGSFDLVFLGNVLLHLANPRGALHALWSVTRGEFISLETVSLVDTLLHPRRAVAELWTKSPISRWWTPNVAAHRHLIAASGFEILQARALVFQRFGSGIKVGAWKRWLGLPGSVVRARPQREAQRAMP